MYLIGSLLLALGISVFAVSKVAEMLHAKKPGMERILLASLVGSIAAFATIVVLGAFVKDVDTTLMLILSLLAMFIVSTLAFKSINVMSWSGAITTNVANIALVLITGTAAVVLNGESIDKTIASVENTFKTNSTIVENIATGKTDGMNVIDESNIENKNEIPTEKIAIDGDLDPSIKELDLVPASTVKKLDAKKEVVFKAPKYRVISLNNIRSAMDENIRIESTNGHSIVGALKNIDNNDLIIEQRINGGLATIPIAFSKIQKVEVYR